MIVSTACKLSYESVKDTTHCMIRGYCPA